MSWQLSSESGGVEVLTGFVEPLLETRTAPGSTDVANDWLCSSCLNRVANEKDRFLFHGQDEFTFSNPAGIHFEIITFTQTRGCRQTGTPTLEHTWFAGHAWSYCQCEGCGQHLGWFYTGPDVFAGLIKNRLVRALHIRN